MDTNHGRSTQMHSPTQHPLPDIPLAVNTLLDTTRRLESSIVQWAALHISEVEVSDVFVAVGNSFHEMLAAFAAYGIDMRDVSGFLDDLRRLLEECLSEDPTPQNINYLQPQVRSIIAKLLEGLRNKQPIYWQAVNARRSGSVSGSSSSSGFR
ncbi:hypothetical protein DFH11DRAFT_1725054 [Phellopilus nigrolimitatus]|nr:hypothetical protein DFH11DRAFT_1725054 [Phellopilus nigrolimitatus]